jgi:membrane protein
MSATVPGRRVASRLRELHPRRTARALLGSFDEHDLLTYATAIAFNALFAVIVLVLLGIALLGALHLDGVWVHHLAPDLRRQVSPAVFKVLDDTVRRVLGSGQAFWITLGTGLTVWEVSGAMRSVMTVLDRIYRVRRTRSRRDRYGVSLVLSAVVTVLVLLAAAAFELWGTAARAVLGEGGAATAVSLLRWPLTAALLLAALATVVRWAPAQQRPWHWVSFGTGLVVVAWLAMSVLFGLYVREVADYGSIFGNLATVIIAFEYAYGSAIVFLAGLALDGIAQEG